MQRLIIFAAVAQFCGASILAFSEEPGPTAAGQGIIRHVPGPAQSAARPNPSEAQSPPEALATKLARLLEPQPGGDEVDPLAQRKLQSPGALAELDAAELQALLSRVVQLQLEDMQRLSSGDRWRAFLRLEELERLTGRPAGGDTSETLARLQEVRMHEILVTFERVNRDAKFAAVADRWTFQAVRLTLAEMLDSPANRAKRRAAIEDVNALEQALSTVSTGEHWAEFLELQQLATILATPALTGGDESGRLELILARFDATARDAQFSTVTKLAGFGETYRRLQDVLGQVSEVAAEADASPSLEVETIIEETDDAAPAPVLGEWRSRTGSSRRAASAAALGEGDIQQPPRAANLPTPATTDR